MNHMVSSIDVGVIREVLWKSEFGIAEVLDLLSYDWAGFMQGLGRESRNEAMVVYQFLIGSKDEYDDGYWDGGNDDDLKRRVSSLLEKLSHDT